MWEWLAGNAEALNVLANVGMLIVWISYLQLFLAGYRRERRSKILVNRGAGTDMTAHCLLTNMSAESIYVQSIVARLEAAGGTVECQLTDLETIADGAGGRDSLGTLKQGPLAVGRFIDIGTFENLVEETASRAQTGTLEAWRRTLEALEITVVAVYGSEDMLVGAKRRFLIERADGRLALRASTIDTSQIRSRAERRRLAAVLEGWDSMEVGAARCSIDPPEPTPPLAASESARDSPKASPGLSSAKLGPSG